MVQTPDFLKQEVESITTNEVHELAEFIKEYDYLVNELTKLDQVTAKFKKRFNTLSFETIPDFLLQHGISEMKLHDGRKVTIKEDISATVKDKVAFRQWLKDRNEDDIIKTKYIFAKLQSDKLR